MPENAVDIKPKRTYDPFDVPKKIPRRTLLRQAAAVIGLGAVAGTAIGVPTVLAPRTETPQPAEKSTLEKLIESGVELKHIYIGDVKITKKGGEIELKVRSETNTVSGTVTEWSKIKTWNGVDISGFNSFVVKNCLFVEGQNEDVAGSKGEKGLWIVGLVGTDTFGSKAEAKYVNRSSSTASFVETLSGGVFQNIDKSKISKDGIVTVQGEKFTSNQIGLVTPLSKTA